MIDSFGSSEGLVGNSLPDGDALVFAEDGCIVELVDDQDRPVAAGTPSDAVLITVLANRLQPLIRYRLSDSFVEQPPVDGHGYLRARVRGTGGRRLPLRPTWSMPPAWWSGPSWRGRRRSPTTGCGRPAVGIAV